MVFYTDASILHLFNKLLDAPAEDPSPIPVELQEDMVVTTRYQVDNGPSDKPPKLVDRSTYDTNGSIFNLEWIVG